MFRALAPPQAACGHLMYAFKLLANLPTGGDNLMDTIFEGLQEQGRFKITSERRRLKEVDNHEAVKIGDLRNSEAIEVVKSKFNKKIYQSAAVREGADELTLREGDALLHQHRQCGSQQMEATAGGRRLAHSLSSHLRKASRERNGRTCITSLR